MLCVLAVFLPSFFMEGAARELFVPLSLAVGFAMVAAYFLSSTLRPVMSVWMLRPDHVGDRGGRAVLIRSISVRLRPHPGSPDALAMGRRGRRISSACGLVIVLVGSQLGMEIFPKVNAGEFQLRLRGPDGTRIEVTERARQPGDADDPGRDQGGDRCRPGGDFRGLLRIAPHQLYDQ